MSDQSSWLTTAVDAVVRAGDAMMSQFGGEFRVDKKGAIDLVTEVDVAIERMFRALIPVRCASWSIVSSARASPIARILQAVSL